MSDATIGLLGVGVGALLAGGLQQIAAWLDRRRMARTAARVLHASLTGPGVSLSHVRNEGQWFNFRPLGPALDAWAVHQRDVAHGLRAWQWHAIAGAFDALAYMEELRAGAAETKAPEKAWALVEDHLDEDLVRIQRALDLLWGLGASPWDRAKMLRRLRREGAHKPFVPFQLPRA
jgi:hypothetical protein